MSNVRAMHSARREEEALARRRDAEHDRLEMWNGIKSYFKGWEVKAHKHNDWTSNDYYNFSEHCRHKAEQVERHKAQLESRRERLRALFAAEEVALAKEMRLSTANDPARMKNLEVFTVELKRKEEEARRREAELMLHQQWKTNTPRIRDHERKLNTNFVREVWMNQVREKQKEVEQKELEEKVALKRKELEAIEEERREKNLEEKRKQRAIDLQQQLLKQIEELREKEAQAEALKAEEAESIRKKAEIDGIAAERSLAERRRKNIEHSWYLTQQWQLRLRRGVRAVQEELAFELKLLGRLLEQEEAVRSEEMEKKSRARQDMLSAQAALEEQARREREREENMHFLFQEEARKMWDQQEARWNAEREARCKLMNDVLATLQEQIREKISRNLEEQRQLLKEREALLDQVEEANAELKAQQAALEKSKASRRQEIDSQVREKHTRAMEQLRIDEEELKRNIEKEKKQEEKILHELKEMDTAGYKPKEAGRKRLLW